MGAETFYSRSSGKTAKQAFKNAVEYASYQYGHAGYTGTIAEKDNFVVINLPEGRDPEEYANHLIDECDERIDDKWGPAGCFKIAEDEYFFFGWASS